MSKALPGLIDVFAILSFSFLVGTKLKTLMNCLSQAWHDNALFARNDVGRK